MSDWRARSVLRQAGLTLALLAGLGVFLRVVHAHYPIQKWLFWRYAACWLLSGLFAVACTSVGFATLRVLVSRGRFRPAELLVTGFALGVVEFFSGMFVAGLSGLFGPLFFYAYPLLLTAVGARPLYVFLRRWIGHARARRAGSTPAPLWLWLVGAFGVIALLAVYFPILNPENASFDSRWQHLGIAEHYAVARRIERFPEGWFVASSPHLAAVLYTWAFLMPGSMLFDRVELAAHVELVCFLATLPGIVVLVRRLVPRSRGRFAWVARFLFPGILVYDSSLVIGADHVAAVFAVPIFLSLLRAWHKLDGRELVLLGSVISGALMTKYTGALLLVGFPLCAVGLRALVLAVRALRRKTSFGFVPGLGAFAATGLALTAPHWLKNWLWYGNPLYPLAHRVFPGSHPWTSDAEDRFLLGFVQAELWQPERSLAGLWQSLKVLGTFSFVPNDWAQFHGKVPVFGSLFTLSLLALPFLGKQRRLWALFGAAHVGVFLWYWTHHQDRYLQAALPWLAAATAATLILVWRVGVASRIAASALVVAQVVWSADAPFIAAHAMTGQALESAMKLVATGYKKAYDKRLEPFGPYYEAGSVLSRTDKVLIHESRPRVGLRARGVSDLPGNQGGISYGLLETPRAVHDLLRSYGVTHLWFETAHSREFDSIAGDLVFWHYVRTASEDRHVFGNMTLARLPERAPDGPFRDTVLLLACDARGLYHVRDLRDHGYRGKPAFPPPIEPAPASGSPLDALLGKAAFVVVDVRCDDSSKLGLGTRFERICSGKRREIWLAKP